MSRSIVLGYYAEWLKLWQFNKEKLPADTPLAHDNVQDNDPKPYRHDRRIDFGPFPSQHLRTHHAILSLVSDDEHYRLFFTLEELTDDKVKEPVEVYRRQLDTLENQTFVIDSREIRHAYERILADCKIKVVIGAFPY